jgi:hypothetical protein
MREGKTAMLDDESNIGHTYGSTLQLRPWRSKMAELEDLENMALTLSLSSSKSELLPGGGTVKSTPMGCGTMSIYVEVTYPDGDTATFRLNRAEWKPIGLNGLQFKFMAGSRILVRRVV